MDWKNKTVLVTEAGSFIGRHLVETLLAEGARVRAFASSVSCSDPGLLSHLPAESSERLEVISLDLSNPIDMRAIYDAAQGCELGYHMGVLSSIPNSACPPDEEGDGEFINFMITLNLLMACREMGMTRLVVACSNEVQFTASRGRITDVDSLEGQSLFSAAEYGVEKLVENFYDEYRLPVVTVRLLNTFGPRQSGRAVIPSIISQALAGNTIHLANPDTVHDFTYISDTVRGFLLAGSTIGVEGGVFDLRTGNDIRLGDLAERIALKIGRPVRILVEPPSLPPEISTGAWHVSEPPLARTALGWEPQVSLDEGLNRTIAWMQSHMDLYPPGQYEF